MTEIPAAPPISIAIATRNRGNSVLRTIHSLFQNKYPCFEIIIVDQSENDLTEKSLRPLLDDPRIHYVKTATTGVSTGRNLGTAQATNELIAMTDDDCEVPANWLQEIASALNLDPRIGIVFGNVLPSPGLPHQGFTTTYIRKEPFLCRSIRKKEEVEGVSSCMGLRQSVWQRLGGFDPLLGIGAPFQSAEESDLAVRVLLAGYFVYETPAIQIIHHGFYPRDQYRAFIRRNWFGTGAMFAKQVKNRHWSIFPLLLRLGWRWGFGQSRIASCLGGHPHRFLRLVSFANGFATGLLTPIDTVTGHFASLR